MTTPECDAAQNRTTPPPPKPANLKVRSFSDFAVRELIPFVNASLEYQSLVESTNVYCSIGDDSNSTYNPCSWFNDTLPQPPTSLRRRDSLIDMGHFPMPPTDKRQYVFCSTFDLVLFALYTIVVICICISAFSVRARQYPPLRQIEAVMSWIFSWELEVRDRERRTRLDERLFCFN